MALGSDLILHSKHISCNATRLLWNKAFLFCHVTNFPLRIHGKSFRSLRFVSDAAESASIVEEANLLSAPNQNLIDLNPPRGTRDFYPEEMRLRHWLFDNFREVGQPLLYEPFPGAHSEEFKCFIRFSFCQVSRLFGFEEVDFPVLESEELYVRKAGEEITQQVQVFCFCRIF